MAAGALRPHFQGAGKVPPCRTQRQSHPRCAAPASEPQRMSLRLEAFRRPPRAWDRPLLSRAAPIARLAGVATVSIARLLNRCPQCVVKSAAPARRPGPACGPCHRHHIPTPPPVCVRAPPHLTGTRRGPHVPLVARAPTAAPVPPLRPRRCVAHSSHVFPHVPCVVLTPLQPPLVSSPCEETIARVPMHRVGTNAWRPRRARALPSPRRSSRPLLYAWWHRRGAWAAREPPARAALPSSHPDGDRRVRWHRRWSPRAGLGRHGSTTRGRRDVPPHAAVPVGGG